MQLALLLTGASFTASVGEWVGRDVLEAVLGGIALGWLIGKLFGWLAFRLRGMEMSRTGDGLAALGLTFICFGAVQQLGLNGFLAVFVMALTFRSSCPENRFHRALTDFARQVEQLATMAVLVVFGGALAQGLVAPFDARDVLLALTLLLVVRPLTAWVSLIGSPHPPVSRALTAFFGPRGIGAF